MRMILFLKAIYRLSVIPIKSPIAFFTHLEQKNLNLYRNTHTKTLNSKSKLEKEKMKPEESGSRTSDYTTKLK